MMDSFERWAAPGSVLSDWFKWRRDRRFLQSMDSRQRGDVRLDETELRYFYGDIRGFFRTRRLAAQRRRPIP